MPQHMLTEDKNSLLVQLIEELSSEYLKEDKISDMIARLQEIYRGEFRHFYSRIYGAISRQNNKYGLECLNGNLSVLFDAVHGEGADLSGEFITKFDKLYDHVSLTCAQIALPMGLTEEQHVLAKKWKYWMKK